MPFLRINGWQVPIVSMEEMPREIGGRSIALDGTPLSEIRDVKRVWRCRTRPVNEIVAEALRGVLIGRGFVWPYETDLVSFKGLAPKTGSDDAVPHTYLAADGSPVESLKYLSGGTLSSYSPNRGGILSVDPTTQNGNQLPADSRDAEVAPTGYTAINGASLSGNTTHFWQGSRSLRIVTDVSGSDQEGAYAADVNGGSNGEVLVGSVYLKGATGGEAVSVYLRDNTNAVNGTATTVTLTTGWTRVACSHTLTADSSDVQLRVVETSADSGITIYADGWQIEIPDGGSNASRYPTAWTDGTSPAGDLVYENAIEGTVDWSIGCWLWGPDKANFNAAREDAYAWILYDPTGGTSLEASLIRRNASRDQLTFRTVEADGTVNDLTTAAIIFQWEEWQYIGCTIRMDPETGEFQKQMRIFNSVSSGVTATAGSATDVPAGVSGQEFHVGGRAALNQWIGHLAQPLIWPFAATADVWAGIATILGADGAGGSGTFPLPRWPRKLVTGTGSPLGQSLDVIQLLSESDRPLFEARVKTLSRTQAFSDAAWRNSMASVEFDLMEV